MGKECQTIAILTSKLCQYVIAQTECKWYHLFFCICMPRGTLKENGTGHRARLQPRPRWTMVPYQHSSTLQISEMEANRRWKIADLLCDLWISKYDVSFTFPSAHLNTSRIDCKDPNLRSSNDKQTAGVLLFRIQPTKLIKTNHLASKKRKH